MGAPPPSPPYDTPVAMQHSHGNRPVLRTEEAPAQVANVGGYAYILLLFLAMVGAIGGIVGKYTNRNGHRRRHRRHHHQHQHQHHHHQEQEPLQEEVDIVAATPQDVPRAASEAVDTEAAGVEATAEVCTLCA